MDEEKSGRQKLKSHAPDSDLIAKARAVLDHNDLGDYIVPSRGLYPHQVLWDSCFVAIGLSHQDLDKAKLQIRRLFKAQWQNGMVPHIVFSEGSHYWWDRRGWKSWINPKSAKGVASSGISQPPMLAEAIVRIGRKLSPSERRLWYKSVYHQLVAYHEWFYRERNPDGDGLVVQIHPWEIGLDNSPSSMVEVRDKSWPLWLRFLELTRFDQIGNAFRVDTKYVPNGQRSSNLEALAFFRLQVKIRRRKYESKRILKKPFFAITDVTYNSILIRANSLLEEIAKALDEKLPEQLTEKFKRSIDSIEKFWDETDEQYYCLKYRNKQQIKTPSIATFLPLYSGAISQARADKLVKLMSDSASYGFEYPIPTVPINSKWFDPVCYWQGPTWVNTNWLIIDGLRRYGFNDQADRLTRSTLKMVKMSGFYEYFDPSTGAPRGVNNFSWTAALTLDLEFNLN